MESNFKIGDKVKEVFTGHDYEIIADEETPYTMTDGEEIFPISGNQFVLKRLKPDAGASITPFIHTVAPNITKIKE